MRRRLGMLVAALAIALPTTARGQSSVYSVLGLGLPPQPFGVRARALGGAVVGTDAESPVNPATVADFRGLTVVTSASASRRGFEIGSAEGTGLTETRFPLAMIAGTIPGLPVSFAGSFTNYLDRTYDISVEDTVMLRGAPVAVTDRLRSRGAIADVRGALAVRVSNRVSVGGGVHLMNGSTRINLRRAFSDLAFVPLDDRAVERFSSVGFSGGFMAIPVDALRLGASFRHDTPLEISRDGAEQPGGDLPVTFTAGLSARLLRGLALSASGQWRSWSEAGDDLGAGQQAFDTWWMGTGLSIGGAESGGSGLPLRAGVRYATLPFSPTGDQPDEWNIGFGTGLVVAGGRGVIDVAVERVLRSGGGAEERVWQFSLGLVLQP